MRVRNSVCKFQSVKNGFNLNIKPENVQKKKKKLKKIMKNLIKKLRSVIKEKNLIKDLNENTKKMAKLK